MFWGGNWDPTDKKFSSVNSYRQDLLPTCKAFPKETTACIWFTHANNKLLVGMCRCESVALPVLIAAHIPA